MKAPKRGKQLFLRILIYSIGILFMNLGNSLTVQADIGVSASYSLPYSISTAFGLPLSQVIFTVYCTEIALQFLIRGKHRRWRDLWQLPLALAGSSFTGAFLALDPFHYELLWQRSLVLAAGLVLSGAGISMSVCMRVVPGAPAGFVDAVSWRTGLELGLVKNLVDAAFVLAALVIDLVTGGRVVSFGVGTVVAVLVVGRVVSLVNRLFLKRMLNAAGLSAEQETRERAA